MRQLSLFDEPEKTVNIKVDGYLEIGATISDCERYRYVLWRWWKKWLRPAIFVGLNPSTADETDDDATIRKCVGFAERWGCGGIIMLNLFAFRATDPKQMLKADNPIGPENDAVLREHLVSTNGILVAAWGAHGHHLNRDVEVSKITDQFRCLGTTKDGSPRHPLYVKYQQTLHPWKPNER